MFGFRLVLLVFSGMASDSLGDGFDVLRKTKKRFREKKTECLSVPLCLCVSASVFLLACLPVVFGSRGVGVGGIASVSRGGEQIQHRPSQMQVVVCVSVFLCLSPCLPACLPACLFWLLPLPHFPLESQHNSKRTPPECLCVSLCLSVSASDCLPARLRCT